MSHSRYDTYNATKSRLSCNTFCRSFSLPAAEPMFILALHRQQSRFSQLPCLLLVYSFRTEPTFRTWKIHVFLKVCLSYTLLHCQCLCQQNIHEALLRPTYSTKPPLWQTQRWVREQACIPALISEQRGIPAQPLLFPPLQLVEYILHCLTYLGDKRPHQGY